MKVEEAINAAAEYADNRGPIWWHGNFLSSLRANGFAVVPIETLTDKIRANLPDGEFGVADICRLLPGHGRKAVLNSLAYMIKAGDIVRVKTGRYLTAATENDGGR